jgi:hypothetical protein
MHTATRGDARWRQRGVLLVALVVVLASAMRAEAASGPSTTNDPVAKYLNDRAVVDATSGLRVAESALEDIENKIPPTRMRASAADSAITGAQGRLDATQAQLDRVKKAIETRAVGVYQHDADPAAIMLSLTEVSDVNSAAKYANALTKIDKQNADQLQQVIDAQTADLQSARDLAVRMHQELDDMERQRIALGQQAVTFQQQLDHLGKVPVMGKPILTVAQLGAWFRSTNHKAHLEDGTTIDELAGIYIAEGSDEGVRGDLAFVQAIIETGFFAEAPRNNFAGIGTCDSCEHGYSFTSPRDGVRAQIQLLRAYADPDSKITDLHHAPSAVLYGTDPITAAARWNGFSRKGQAPTWDEMGDGNWATDPLYSSKILRMYGRILDWVTANS